MTIDQLQAVADAVEITDDNRSLLEKSLRQSEAEFEAEQQAKAVTHEWLQRGYTF